MFKLVKENLPQIEAILAAFGEVHVHGDGNMYVKEVDSKFRRDYSNPDSAGKYRVSFVKGDHIPETITELETLMINNTVKDRQKEEADARRENRITSIRVKEQEKPGLAADPDDDDEPGTTSLDRYRETLSTRAMSLDSKAEVLSDREANLAKQARDLEARQADLERKSAELEKKLAEAQAAKPDEATATTTAKPGAKPGVAK